MGVIVIKFLYDKKNRNSLTLRIVPDKNFDDKINLIKLRPDI